MIPTRTGQPAGSEGVQAGLRSRQCHSVPPVRRPGPSAATEWARVAVVLETTGDVIEEIELCKAFFQVYDGAVYLHQARTYVCSKLDLNDMVAHVRPVRVKYFTSLIDFTDVHVIGGNVAYRHVARSG